MQPGELAQEETTSSRFHFFFKYEESEITKIEFMKSATKYVEEIYVRYDEHKYRNWQKFQNLSLELS